MATVTKRRILLTIEWMKETPNDLNWSAQAICVTPDDKEDTNEESFIVQTDPQTITRAQFRTITGQQIETTVLNAINNAIQQLGVGAGTHILNDDFGN